MVYMQLLEPQIFHTILSNLITAATFLSVYLLGLTYSLAKNIV